MGRKKYENISSFLLKIEFEFDIVRKMEFRRNKNENCRTMDKSRKI